MKSSSSDNIEVASAANSDSKNKDGNGNKRKNRRSPTDSLTSGDVRVNASPQSLFRSMEDFVAHEEMFLNGVFNVLSQVNKYSIYDSIKQNNKNRMKLYLKL